MRKREAKGEEQDVLSSHYDLTPFTMTLSEFGEPDGM